MTKEYLKIRSSVSSLLLRRFLFRGYAIASVGILILIIAGSLLQIEYLHRWGWVLFFLAMGCVTAGMLPYRRLSRLQLNPNELTLVDHDHVLYSDQGKPLFLLPLKSVDQTRYISHTTLYGIAVWLKSDPIEPIRIFHSPKEVEKLRRKGNQMDQADLFFPYFNQQAYEEWIEWAQEKAEN